MIRDLKEGKVSLPVLITRADSGKTNKNTPYLAMTFEDASGVLDAKFWNLTEEQVARWKPGMVVEAKGDLILYKNVPQLRVRTLTELPEENMLDYVRSAPESAEQMRREINRTLESIQSPILRDVTTEVLRMVEDDFYRYPAAVRNHHNFPGGLAYHTLSMLRIGEQISALYPWLDADLIRAGILLHDLGKVVELSSPILPEYTPQGNLIGHISIVNTLIDRIAVALEVENTEEVMLLKHMVLAHHGRLEYGSPVLPMIPEAEVLSLIDNMDARLMMMRTALDEITPGTFGPRIFALDNRMLYRRKSDQKEEEAQEEAAEGQEESSRDEKAQPEESAKNEKNKQK